MEKQKKTVTADAGQNCGQDELQRDHYKAHAERLAEALNELDMAHNHKTLCRAKEKAREALAQWETAQK